MPANPIRSPEDASLARAGYGHWFPRFRVGMGPMSVRAGTWPLGPEKVPFKALLMEGEDSVPFTFSPVAPGYFLPSPSWIRAPGPGLIAPRRLPTYVAKPRLLMWSALHVRDLLSRMRDALGPTLVEIRSSAVRARQSRTPPAQPHPLVELLERLSVVYLYESDARPYLDPALVAQLHAECAIVERATQESVWDEIRAGCVTASGYSHTLAAFLAIDMLERRTSIGASSSVNRNANARTGYPTGVRRRKCLARG
jgi:hypothetical protein